MLKSLLNGTVMAAGIFLLLIGLNLFYASEEGKDFNDMELTAVEALAADEVIPGGGRLKVFGTMDSGGNGTGDGAALLEHELHDDGAVWRVSDFVLLPETGPGNGNGTNNISVNMSFFNDIRKGRHHEGSYRDGDMACIIGYWKDGGEGEDYLEAKVVARDPDDFYEDSTRGPAIAVVGCILIGFALSVYIRGFLEERRFYSQLGSETDVDEPGEGEMSDAGMEDPEDTRVENPEDTPERGPEDARMENPEDTPEEPLYSVRREKSESPAGTPEPVVSDNGEETQSDIPRRD